MFVASRIEIASGLPWGTNILARIAGIDELGTFPGELDHDIVAQVPPPGLVDRDHGYARRNVVPGVQSPSFRARVTSCGR